jgi:LacI family transcriptional regulator
LANEGFERLRRSTITDVAKKAGVGKGTVSYVLNGQSRTARISEETAQRVMAAAGELNYRPNALARMLVSQRTDILAVVFQRGYFFTSWSSFTAEVMKGVSTAAVELGYDLMLHTKDVPREEEASVLADGRVDGALILRDENDSTVADLTLNRFPSVRFFSRSNDSTPYVDADNESGGVMATRHLIELGHRRIAMVHGPKHSTSSNDRVTGFRKAMEEAGLEVDAMLLLEMPGDDSEQKFKAMMTSPCAPTAIFAWSDDVAINCMSYLRDLNISIPSEVSVIGFDSLDIANHSVPPLTSVRQPIFEMAKTATQLLVAIIRNQELDHRQILFPLELDLRGSTAPYRKSDS